jgi:hypothetical protein
VTAGKRLIDQALATVAAAQSLGPGDQISLTREQALVWAIYLRVVEQQPAARLIDGLLVPVRAAGRAVGCTFLFRIR